MIKIRNREEARSWFERSAVEDEWTQTRVGLLLYYQYNDYEAGKEYMHRAADAGYEPAKEAIRAINNNLNAQIVIGVCDLFYYASNIIDDKAEDVGLLFAIPFVIGIIVCSIVSYIAKKKGK